MKLTFKLKWNKQTIDRILTMLVIIALFSFGDYSNAVYAIKVFAILGLLLSERVIHSGIHFLWTVGFIIICTVSILWSGNKSNSLFYLVWTMQAMGLAFAIGNTIHSETDIIHVLKCFFIAGVVLAVRVLMSTALSSLGSFRLGTNMGYNANELALKSSIAAVSGLFFLNRQKTPLRRLIITFLIVTTIGVVAFTGSRKGFLTVIMGVVLFYTFRSGRVEVVFRNIIIALILSVFGFVIIIRVPVLYNAIGRRLLLILNLFDSDTAYVGNSIVNRLNFIQIGFRLFLRSPIYGYGIGAFRVVSQTGVYAHNNYIELLTDIGIIGTLFYYSLYYYNTKHLYMTIGINRSLTSLLLSFSIMFVVLEVGLVTFQGDYAQIIIALCYWMTVINERAYRNRRMTEKTV